MIRFAAVHWSVLLLSAVACTAGDSHLPTTPPRFSGLPLASPVGEPLFGTWHRLATGGDPATSEHEVMDFHIQQTIWAGRYDKHPEPSLGFISPSDRTFGLFRGVETTSFVCHLTFPFYPCDNVVFVIEGTMEFHPPDRPPFLVREQHIVVRGASGNPVLWVYWVDPGNFVCPWYRTFDEALATNPFPAHQDCIGGIASP